MVSGREAVLVTGATGLIGHRVVAALHAAGRAVKVVTREPHRVRHPKSVEIVVWNGRTLAPAALRGTSAVVHLAGEPVFGGRLTQERRERIRRSRVDSTESLERSLAALADEDRPGCLVCASAVGYYGNNGDAELDESAAPGDDFLARVCIEWERAANAAGGDGVRTTSLRFGVVFAGDGGALPIMANLFRVGLGGRLGNGRQWLPWIHVEDAVGLVLAALGDERWSGPVNAVAPGIVTNDELTRTLGHVLGRPTLIPVPAMALRLALGELSGQLLGSRRAVPRAAQQRGFHFEYPELEPALRAALDR
jgi:uncharacterized protein (TIGR01777 family)